MVEVFDDNGKEILFYVANLSRPDILIAELTIFLTTVIKFKKEYQQKNNSKIILIGKLHLIFKWTLMKYTIVLKKTEEGYSVCCPDLPGCWSQGDTEVEALENIQDAISEYASARNE